MVSTRQRPTLGRILGVVYAASVALWLLAQHMPLESWWVFRLANIFGVWLYLPLPLLALAAVLRRDPAGAAWLAIPAVAFAIEYGAAFLPHRVGAAEGIPLRVMTINLTVENRDVAAFAAVVGSEAPDVVAVQELGIEMARSAGPMLWERYPYQALHPRRSDAGMGVLSRYPLRELGPPEMGPGTCSCQQMSIDLGPREMQLISVHPDPPRVILGPQVGAYRLPNGYDTALRDGTVLLALERLEATGPAIVAGDFNMSDREDLYRQIRARLGDAYREAGWGLGYTFPTFIRDVGLPFPLVRIDHIFHNDAWTARAAWVGTLPGSDHRYVVADLVLR